LRDDVLGAADLQPRDVRLAKGKGAKRLAAYSSAVWSAAYAEPGSLDCEYASSPSARTWPSTQVTAWT
jgi:hypothetical protein